MAGGAAIPVKAPGNAVYLVALKSSVDSKKVFVDDLVYVDLKEAIAVAVEAMVDGEWVAQVVEVVLDPDNFTYVPLGLPDGEVMP